MVEMSKELLIRFIDGACTDAELVAVKEWLDESPDHARELFELEQTAMFATELRPDAARSRRVFDKVQQRIFNEELRRRRSSRRLMMRWISAGAAAAVIIAVAGVFFFRTPDVRMLKVMALDQSRELTLPDGSVIYLNAGSELSYPETFGKERTVALSGEGFFKVARDEEHPFVVEGHYINVKVLGTEFNVNSYADSVNNVSLVEGSVEVSAAKASGDGVVLLPGQKANFDPVAGTFTVVETNAEVDAAWHDRIIPFSNASVRDIVDILNQLYKVNIAIADDVDLSKTYSGVTVYYSSVDSTLEQLCNTLPIDFQSTGDTFTISSKKVIR